MHKQTVFNYPAAASNADSDIINAAKSRANFWNYKINGYWTVTVRVSSQSTVEVSHNPDKGFYIQDRPRATPRPVSTGSVTSSLCLALVFLVSLSGCYNFTGENHTKATKEAKAYATAANEAGADVKFISCMDHDTDGDGYLACDFIINGAPQTLDCAGRSALQDNHGCKVYVAKLRVTNVNSQ